MKELWEMESAGGDTPAEEDFIDFRAAFLAERQGIWFVGRK
jgi:hypothetical protein